ncbi:MAG TPA: hypothetical protein VJ724_01130 [Tahibacter sp.]|nr:hypothetical protein [Tahibacter sp.]
MSFAVAAVEPAFTCRIGNADIASDLRTGGANTVVALRPNGNPVVAYFNLPPPGTPQTYPPDAALYLHLCEDPECTRGKTKTLETSVAVASVDLSIALRADGAPILSYYSKNPAWPGVRIYVCANAQCSPGAIRQQTTELELGVTTHVSISPEDRPFVVFGDRRPDPPVSLRDDLAACRCTDAACSSTVCRTLDHSARNGLYPWAIWRTGDGGDGTALISHVGYDGAYAYQCANSDCSAGLGHMPHPRPAGAGGGSYSSIVQRTSGLPLIVYGQFYAPPNLPEYGLPTLVTCADANCTSGTPRALDPAERNLRLVRMAVRPNGRPLVTWGETGGADSLYLYQCANRDCTGGRVATTLAGVEVGHDMAMRDDDVAVIAFRPAQSGKVKLAYCALPGDLIFANDFEIP